MKKDEKNKCPYMQKFKEKYGEETTKELDLGTLRDKKGNAYMFFINEQGEIDCKHYNHEEAIKSEIITFEAKINALIEQALIKKGDNK